MGFAARLQLAPQVCKTAGQICSTAYRCDLIRRDGHSAVLAAAVFIVAHLFDAQKKPDFSDVAVIARVSAEAVRAAYKRVIFPHIRRLVPEGFVCKLPGGVCALPQP